MSNAQYDSDQAGLARVPAEEEKVYFISDLIDHIPVAVYVCDGSGALLRFNLLAAELFGWTDFPATAKTNARNGGNGEGKPRLASPAGLPGLEAIQTGRPIRNRDFVVDRPDGTVAVLRASVDPVMDDDGEAIGAVGCLQDVTDRHRVEFEQKALLDELNHRVKNTLSTVQLLARQTIRKSGLPVEVQDDFEGRLIALSRAHDHLTRGRWTPVDLRTIIENAVAPYCDLNPETLRIRGEQIEVGAQASLTLAMIFHELATNAAKYGALSSADGRLAVSWSVAEDEAEPNLVINWEETGGPPVREPVQPGFGSRLLEHGIARQFRGSARLDYDPSGLRCTMQFPLPSTSG